MKRREFLQASLGSAAVVSLSGGLPSVLQAAGRRLGGTRGDRVLVVLQLTGGNDGLNTIVPYADDVYARNRFALRLSANEVLKIDNYLGFHPRLGGVARLYEQGRVGIVQGVGYPNPNRSHFESMDIWHTAHAEAAPQPTGWLGRMLDARVPSNHQAPWALHLGRETQPLALAGRRVRVPSMNSPEAFRLRMDRDADALATVERLSRAPREESSDLLAFLDRSTNTAITSSRQVQTALSRDGSTATYPGGRLASRLRTMAQLIDADLGTRVFYVTLDGFDTHADQADAHAGLMNELGGCLEAFMTDLDARGHAERVCVAVFSEFGRRVRENASRGTDHGAAAPMLLVGGAVQSGLLGRYPSLTDLDDGDLKHTVDFRGVYATLLEDWLDCPADQVLAGRFDKLELFAPRA